MDQMISTASRTRSSSPAVLHFHSVTLAWYSAGALQFVCFFTQSKRRCLRAGLSASLSEHMRDFVPKRIYILKMKVPIKNRTHVAVPTLQHNEAKKSP